MQKLDGYQNLISRLGLIEKHDRLQVFAHGDSPAIEVDDLRDGAIGVGPKMEPDAAARQIIAVQGLRHFDQAAIPHRFVRSIRSRLDDWPTAVVEIDGLSVLHVSGMKPPFLRRKVVQPGQFLDHFLRWSGEGFYRLRSLLRHRISLRLRWGGQKEESDGEKLVLMTAECGEHANRLRKIIVAQAQKDWRIIPKSRHGWKRFHTGQMATDGCPMFASASGAENEFVKCFHSMCHEDSTFSKRLCPHSRSVGRGCAPSFSSQVRWGEHGAPVQAVVKSMHLSGREEVTTWRQTRDNCQSQRSYCRSGYENTEVCHARLHCA